MCKIPYDGCSRSPISFDQREFLADNDDGTTSQGDDEERRRQDPLGRPCAKNKLVGTSEWGMVTMRFTFACAVACAVRATFELY